MNTPDKTHWLQRFENFSRAFSQLAQACNRNHYNDLERAGLIKTFEFCFELSWNALEDLLTYQGYIVKMPREVIRQSFEVGYISEDDCETLLEALEKRNILSDIYKKDIAREAETLIREHYYPVLLRIHATLNEKSRQ